MIIYDKYPLPNINLIFWKLKYIKNNNETWQEPWDVWVKLSWTNYSIHVALIRCINYAGFIEMFFVYNDSN